MAAFIPGWCQGGTYLAQHDRINGRAAMFDEGILSRFDLKVVQRGAGANLSVDISAGGAVVTGDDQANQGNYQTFFDAVTNVTGFVATGSNTRYDLVGVQINDPNAGGAAGSNAVLVRVAGTAAPSPTIPALPNSFLPLAVIGPFTTSTTSITNAMIHTAHTGTGPTGTTAIGLVAGLRDTPASSKETYNTVADNGWLMEFGQAVSRTTYARLFEHIGTTHGVGDGATTFNLPDSRGRVAVAADNMGGTDAGVLTSSNVLGTKMGAETVTLTAAQIPAHTHPIDHDHPSVNSSNESNDHTHNVATTPYTSTPTGPGAWSVASTTVGSAVSSGVSAPHYHTVDLPAFSGTSGNNAGGGGAHSVMQPSITVNRMIRT